MTMLMHTRGPLEWAPYSSQRRDTVAARSAAAHMAMIKRFCVGGLMVLAAGGALAAIIALKAATFFGSFIIIDACRVHQVAIRDGSNQTRNGW